MSLPASTGRIFGLSLLTAAFGAIVGLGALGCGKAPADPGPAQGRARALERRCVQLEQDYRTVAKARDAANKELALLRGQLAEQSELRQQVSAANNKWRVARADGERTRAALIQRTVERDNLQTELAARASEREVLASRCEKLRKGLQSLLSQDDNSGPTVPSATGPNTEPPLAGGE